MAQREELQIVARPAPPLSRSTRRRLALSFGVVALLCLGLSAALFLVTRAVPNGRVGTGPYSLAVDNRLAEAVCAIHVGEASAHTALSRNKLGTGVLRSGDQFRLTGLDARPYALQAWTCDGRTTRLVVVDPDAGETVWRITPAELDTP